MNSVLEMGAFLQTMVIIIYAVLLKYVSFSPEELIQALDKRRKKKKNYEKISLKNSFSLHSGEMLYKVILRSV